MLCIQVQYLMIFYKPLISAFSCAVLSVSEQTYIDIHFIYIIYIIYKKKKKSIDSRFYSKN